MADIRRVYSLWHNRDNSRTLNHRYILHWALPGGRECRVSRYLVLALRHRYRLLPNSCVHTVYNSNRSRNHLWYYNSHIPEVARDTGYLRHWGLPINVEYRLLSGAWSNDLLLVFIRGTPEHVEALLVLVGCAGAFCDPTSDRVDNPSLCDRKKT